MKIEFDKKSFQSLGIDKFTAILIIILLAFLAIGSINIGYKIPGWDESAHFYQAKVILDNAQYAFCQVDPRTCDIYPPQNFGPLAVPMYTDHPPLGKLIFAAGILGGFDSGRLLILLFGAAFIASVFFLSRELYGNTTAVIAAILTSLSLPVFEYSRLMFPDIPVVFFMTSSLLFFWMGKKKWEYMIVGGALAGLAILAKLPALAIIVPISLFAVLFIFKLKTKDGFELISINEQKTKYFIYAIIVLVLIGIVIYNLMAMSIYGALPFEINLAYQGGSGKLSAGTGLDIVGWLGSTHAIMFLFPLPLIAMVYFLLRRKPEDIYVLAFFIPFAAFTLLRGNTNAFTGPFSWLHYLLLMVAPMAIATAELLRVLFKKYKLLIPVIIIIILIQVYVTLPFYAPSYGAEKFRPAIAELENKVPKEIPILSAYNSLALRHYYGWQQVFAIDSMQTEEIKQLVKANLNKTTFTVLIQHDWGKTEEVNNIISQLCPHETITVTELEVFRLYRC